MHIEVYKCHVHAVSMIVYFQVQHNVRITHAMYIRTVCVILRSQYFQIHINVCVRASAGLTHGGMSTQQVRVYNIHRAATWHANRIIASCIYEIHIQNTPAASVAGAEMIALTLGSLMISCFRKDDLIVPLPKPLD